MGTSYLEATARKWHSIAYSMEVVEALCKAATRWAYILHDKDLKEDGTLKGPHYHVYTYFKNERKGNGLVALAKRTAPEDNNLIVAVQNDSADAIDYFTHESEEAKADGKTIYPQSAIVFDEKGRDEHFLHYDELQRLRKATRKAKQAEKQEERAEQIDSFLSDLILHGEKPYYMARRYGTAFIISRDKYLQFRATLLESPIADLEELPEVALDYVADYQRQRASAYESARVNGFHTFRLDKTVADMYLIITELENERLATLSVRPVDVQELSRIMGEITELRSALCAYLPAIGKTPDYNTDEYFQACLKYYHPDVYSDHFTPDEYCAHD